MSIEEYFNIAIEKKASDIHLIHGFYPAIRVNGELLYLTSYQLLTKETMVVLINQILTSEQKETLSTNRELDFGYTYKDQRFRINAYYTQAGIAASFRLISSNIKTLEELHLTPTMYDFTKYSQGFVLITGPTGEGKSTTLAALINYINEHQAKHIITIEDPVEYIYPKAKSLISQREIGSDTHAWSLALKSSLREDPDVLLIGEMRDFETIQTALTIAETGHLVFSTVHTNSASQTIDRVIDIFPPSQQQQIRIQLASMLRAIVTQRLLPSIDGNSRIPAIELLLNTSAVSSIIREGKTHLIDNVIQTSSTDGMIYFENDLLRLYQQGLISKDIALSSAIRPREIERLLS